MARSRARTAGKVLGVVVAGVQARSVPFVSVVDDMAVVEDDDLVGEAHHHGHLVLDEADRDPAPDDLPDELAEGLGLLIGRPGGRLVDRGIRAGRPHPTSPTTSEGVGPVHVPDGFLDVATSAATGDDTTDEEDDEEEEDEPESV